MFGILKPAPYRERIKDPGVVKKNFRYWQFRTMIGMYLGYFTFYFTRKNIVGITAVMSADLGISLAGLGWILSISALMYGVSKFASGIISDRSNPRYFMSFGLIISGLLNIIFGFSGLFPVFFIVWAANGFFQGWGWPPVSRLLMHWYSNKSRARWWSAWNTSHNVGGALILWFAPLVVALFGYWQAAFIVPGIMAVLMGTALMFILRDTPQSLGLPSVEEYSGEMTSAQAAVQERELSTKELLFKYVLTNRYLWLLAAAYFSVYVVRQAINDWSAAYLVQEKGYRLMTAGAVVSLFEVGGFLGSLGAGFISDLIFKGKRGPTNVLFGLGTLASVLLFWYASEVHWIFSGIALFGIGFSIFGPQMLIGVAAAELSHKKASATATGFIGSFAYLGAAVAGGPIATIAERYGWGAFFGAVVLCAMIAIILLVPLWGVTKRDDAETETSAAAA
ncbi:MAG: MFS transporter [Verrucomicrobia bacterium]|nr:MFS transporter [Verrucomicrobiota bacterium]